MPRSGVFRCALGTGAVLLLLGGCGGGDSAGPAGPVAGGEATRVALAAPDGLALDADGSLYVSEFEGHRVVEVTTDGALIAVAGTGAPGLSGDGTNGTSAELNAPSGLVVTPDGRLLIVDHGNDRIRDLGTDGFISTMPGSVDARLHDPIGIALDEDGAVVVADELNARVVRIAADGTVSIVAGGDGATASPGDGGPATAAALGRPFYVVIRDGDIVFSDFEANRIRAVDRDGTISTLAGTGEAGFGGDGGPATAARMRLPQGLALGLDGELYVSDAGNHRVRRIDPDGTISTVAGTGKAGFGGDDGPATEAMLNTPSGLVVDGEGALYVADFGNDRVRRIGADGVITTVAGSG